MKFLGEEQNPRLYSRWKALLQYAHENILYQCALCNRENNKPPWKRGPQPKLTAYEKIETICIYSHCTPLSQKEKPRCQHGAGPLVQVPPGVEPEPLNLSK